MAILLCASKCRCSGEGFIHKNRKPNKAARGAVANVGKGTHAPHIKLPVIGCRNRSRLTRLPRIVATRSRCAAAHRRADVEQRRHVVFQGLEIGIRTHVNGNFAGAVDDQFRGFANFCFELRARAKPRICSRIRRTSDLNISSLPYSKLSSSNS